MNSVIDEILLQLGPFTQIGSNDINVEAIRAQLERLRVTAENRTEFSRDTEVSGGSGFVGLKEAGTHKLLQAVNSLAPPSGICWRGASDTRSAKRYLDSCGMIAASAGLDSEGLVRYFLVKCVSPSLSEELSSECSSLLRDRPVSYQSAVLRIESYFNVRFHHTNGSDRVSENLENGIWMEGVTDLDGYIRAFKLVCRDCELVGIQLDEKLKRRHFLKSLPEKFRDYAQDICSPEASADVLANRLMVWSTQRNVAFKPAAVIIKRTAAAAWTPGVRKQHGNCFRCASPDHMIRDCPETVDFKKPVEVTKNLKHVDKSDSAKTEKAKLTWAGVVSYIQVGRVSDCPIFECDVKSENANLSHLVEGLLDTGSARTLCSQRFAERPRREIL